MSDKVNDKVSEFFRWASAGVAASALLHKPDASAMVLMAIYLLLVGTLCRKETLK